MVGLFAIFAVLFFARGRESLLELDRLPFPDFALSGLFSSSATLMLLSPLPTVLIGETGPTSPMMLFRLTWTTCLLYSNCCLRYSATIFFSSEFLFSTFLWKLLIYSNFFMMSLFWPAEDAVRSLFCSAISISFIPSIASIFSNSFSQ